MLDGRRGLNTHFDQAMICGMIVEYSAAPNLVSASGEGCLFD